MIARAPLRRHSATSPGIPTTPIALTSPPLASAAPQLGATDWIEDHGPDGTRFGRRRIWCTSRALSTAAPRRLAAAGWVVRQDTGVTRFSRPRL
jgi:hypothetical protein